MHPICDSNKPFGTVQPSPSAVEALLEFLDQGALPYVADEGVSTPADDPFVRTLVQGVQALDTRSTCTRIEPWPDRASRSSAKFR